MDDDDARWAAEYLRHFLALLPRGGTFEAAFELTTFGEEMMSERDRLICEIAATEFPNLEPPGAGRALATEVEQYKRAEWEEDQARGYSLRPATSLRAKLFVLLMLGPVPQAKRLGDIIRENLDQVAA